MVIEVKPDESLIKSGWICERGDGDGLPFVYSKGEHKKLNHYQAWSIENYPHIVEYEEQIEVKCSITLEKRRDGSWRGYPTWADYIVYAGEDKAEVVRRILTDIADSYEEA